MSSIEIKNLNKSFGKHEIINNLSFDIEKGSRVAIIGESGVGKTTLLRMIAGLESYDSGEIIYQNDDKKVAMIFQDGGLFEHALVKDNIIFGLKKLGYSKDKISEELSIITKKLHIDHLLNRYPVSLSSGEKQRVGIARALIRKPDVLLLDEPFSNLDIKLTYELEQELLEIQESNGMTMVIVTHNIDEAFFFGQKIGILKDGKLLEYSSAEELLKHPKHIETLSFLFPNINELNGKIIDHKLYVLDKQIGDITLENQEVKVFVKVESIVLNTGDFIGECMNKKVVRNGFYYQLKINDVRLNCFSEYEINEKTVHFAIKQFYVFNQNGLNVYDG